MSVPNEPVVLTPLDLTRAAEESALIESHTERLGRRALELAGAGETSKAASVTNLRDALLRFHEAHHLAISSAEAQPDQKLVSILREHLERRHDYVRGYLDRAFTAKAISQRVFGSLSTVVTGYFDEACAILFKSSSVFRIYVRERVEEKDFARAFTETIRLELDRMGSSRSTRKSLIRELFNLLVSEEPAFDADPDGFQKYADRPDKNEDAPTFIKRVYGDRLDGSFTRADLRKIDSKAIRALINWETKNGRSDVSLPTVKERNDAMLAAVVEFSSPETRELARLRIALRRRTQKEKTYARS